jgi:hypothetical protein
VIRYLRPWARVLCLAGESLGRGASLAARDFYVSGIYVSWNHGSSFLLVAEALQGQGMKKRTGQPSSSSDAILEVTGPQ